MFLLFFVSLFQDAPMRFFYRVRTNETSIEELPEVPLRRSPSMSDRTQLGGSGGGAGATIPVVTKLVDETTILPATPCISVDTVPRIDQTDVFVKPESRSVKVKNEPITSMTTTTTSSAKAAETKVVAMNNEPSTSSVKSSSDVHSKKSASSTTTTTTTTKVPKVKSAKSEERATAKQQQKEVRKSREEVPEKRVENIKLKIDQNSVTIIKSSTKELKMKFKKERDMKESAKSTSALATSSGKSVSAENSDKKKCDKKRDVASIKLAKVPENSTSNGTVKYEIKSPVDERRNAPLVPKVSPKLEQIEIKKERIVDIDEKKSEFLNSFQLTPTKSLSPEKLQQIKLMQMSPASRPTEKPRSPKSKSPDHKMNQVDFKVPIPVIDSTKKLPKLPSTSSDAKPASKSIADVTSLLAARTAAADNKPSPSDIKVPVSSSSKRKNKEPIRNVPKKSRSNSPVLVGRQPSIVELLKKSKTPPLDTKMYSEAGRSASTPLGPPPSKEELLAGLVKQGPIEIRPRSKPVAIQPKPSSPPILAKPDEAYNVSKSDEAAKKNLSVKPIDKLMPKPLMVTNNVKRPSQSDTPRPLAPPPPPHAATKVPKTTASSNNVTPKKLPNILPKPIPASQMAAPPSILPIMLRNPDTEIKQIKNDGTNKDIKVYGPGMDNKTPHGIQPAGSSSPAYVPSYTVCPPIKPQVGGVPGGYLNYALMNSHKRAMNEQPMPAGMRSPAYPTAQNSPSYSPNSPQYSPSYNIPTCPQYKYMKSPAHISNYFQGPAAQPPSSGAKQPAQSKQTTESKRPRPNEPPTNQQNSTAKRSNPTKIDMDSPPEKQKKVQSLLDSCNISFPSSLSITLHEQNDPASTNPLFNPKRQSPVNNYIEIVKLPDVSVDESKKLPPPPPRQSIPLPPASRTPPSAEKQRKSPVIAPPPPPVVVSNDKIRSSPDRKSSTIPELNRIEKNSMTAAEMQALKDKITFQEKFMQSLSKKEALAMAGNSKSSTKNKPIQPKAILPKPSPPSPSHQRHESSQLPPSSSSSKPTATSPLQFRRPSSSPSSAKSGDIKKTNLSRPPTMQQQPHHHQQLPHQQQRSASSTATKHRTLAPAKPKSKSDGGALDLTAPAIMPASSGARTVLPKPIASMSPTTAHALQLQQFLQQHHHNNNELAKKSASAVVDPADMSAAFFAAAMASHNANSAFMMQPPHPMVLNSMQQQLQQSYFLDHLVRMQKAGHDQLNEVLESFKQNLSNGTSASSSSTLSMLAKKNGDGGL